MNELICLQVVYLTATLPYVLIVALLIRGLTLPGSSEGIYFYIIPNWKTLLDVNVWIAAAIQIFYTYGVAYGVLINMASHNKFSNNICR